MTGPISAYDGDVEAARMYARCARASTEDRNDIANNATEGPILFREGRVGEAVQSYERAIEEAVSQKNVILSLRAYTFLAREMCRIDAGMKAQFRDEFEKVDKMLKRKGVRMPRDVTLIREEFVADGLVSDELQLSFKSFGEIYLEQVSDE